MSEVTKKSAASDAFGECVLIDVRTPAEFRSGSPQGAVNLPLHELSDARLRSLLNGQDHVCFVCASGKRAEKAAEQTANMADIHISCLEGGVQAWQAAGKPLTQGVQTMSIERQVRIAAGSLVLTGVLLSLWVHPAWIGLSGFVGAGLIFAGATDSCMMGTLIARMPWNQ